MPPTDLPAQPVPVSPVGGVQLATDAATLTVQNARGYDQGQAQYTFVVTSASGATELARVTVPAGSRSTTATTPALPRGMSLAWSVTAAGSAGQVSSGVATFRGPAVACQHTSTPYAKQIVGFYMDACSLARNRYTDPQKVLGPPDSQGTIATGLTGIISLGEGGWVDVDMEGCAEDRPGNDVRVYQRASSEPVTLWAGGTPNGPWVLVGYRVPCGDPSGETGHRSGKCEFDLADGEVSQARYFRIQDGELYPCELADTDTEGADIDAIRILSLTP
jgi:hypothetical protein